MPIRDLSANKGEWAELYVLFRLLGDGRLYAADKQLNKKLDSYLDVLNIIREEARDISPVILARALRAW